jgi:peroxin-3
VYLLTSSQLTILARTRYLADIKAANVTRERERIERAAANAPRGLLNYFSVSGMGLSEYADGSSLIPKSARDWFFGVDPTAVGSGSEDPEVVAVREAQIQAQNAESERVFLTYSWWLLHEGWRTVSARVEDAVERVFAPLGLKREITAETWDALVKELRASVETETDGDKVSLYDFTPLIVPDSPLPPTFDECPLPLTPGEHSTYLVSLLSQTVEHVASPDARLIVDKGVSALLNSLGGQLLVTGPRRFADLLPELNAWSRGVWEGIPDGGVEALLALPEFEAFTALVFGDWAPRE